MRLKALMGGISAAVLLSGCGANYNSIYRYQPLPNAEGEAALIAVDAKQRVIIRQGTKICTEPPPDVFSVYAQALGASGSLSKSADPTSLAVAGSLSYAASEQGATIGRTQALNLLALQAYYNCLTNLSGDSGELEAPIDRVRLQRLIVTTLAIEQLTNAIRPATVVIGATGSGSTGSAETVATLDAAWKASQTASTTLADKQKKLDDLTGAAPKCDDIEAKVKAGTALTDDEKTKQPACKTAKDAVTAAKADHEAKDKHYKALLAANGGGAATTAVAHVIEAKVTEATKPSPETVAAVAGQVKSIVDSITNQDETKLFCIRLLGDRARRARDIELSAQCTRLLMANVTQETAIVFGQMNREQQIQFLDEEHRAGQDMRTHTLTYFNNYWAKIFDTTKDAPDPQKVAARIDPLVASSTAKVAGQLTELKKTSDKLTAFQLYGLLPQGLQSQLAL